MQRVRMNAPYYAQNGFSPLVLTVQPEKSGRLVSKELVETVPLDLEVVSVGAISPNITKPFGVSDLSIRAFASLAKAGDRLISSRGIDLVFISTTCFLLMGLGARWFNKYSVPYVLDFQDPWYSAPISTLKHRRLGLKHRVMRRLHARAEALTAPNASGLIAVSEDYIDALQLAYPVLSNVPNETIPFGYSSNDWRVAARQGVVWNPAALERPFIIYAGRVGVDMTDSVNVLLNTLALARRFCIVPLSEMVVGFLGTGYQKSGNPLALPLRSSSELNFVFEQPNRRPLLDSLASIMAADVSLVLGSEDLSYQPSKLYQLMSLRKPIICVAPSASRLAKQVENLRTVAFLPTDRTPDGESAERFSKDLERLLSIDHNDPVYQERDAIAARTSAETLSARECILFERALAHHQTRKA